MFNISYSLDEITLSHPILKRRVHLENYHFAFYLTHNHRPNDKGFSNSIHLIILYNRSSTYTSVWSSVVLWSVNTSAFLSRVWLSEWHSKREQKTNGHRKHTNCTSYSSKTHRLYLEALNVLGEILCIYGSW